MQTAHEKDSTLGGSVLTVALELASKSWKLAVQDEQRERPAINLRRADVFVGGKIAKGWYATVGGFARRTQGVRDAQFPADDGGQLTATLTRKLDGGGLTVYARATDEKNAFYTGVPLISSNNGRDISAFPGFDPLTGTLMSNEMRHFTIDAAPGKTLQRDLADGRGMKSAVFGANYEQKLGGWDVSKRLARILFAQEKIADKKVVFRRLPTLLSYVGDFFSLRSRYYYSN